MHAAYVQLQHSIHHARTARLCSAIPSACRSKNKITPQIRIEAVGKAIDRERKDNGSNERDYALRRAVNVVVRAAGDDAKGKVPNVITGRKVPLTGPPCEAFTQRSLRR